MKNADYSQTLLTAAAALLCLTLGSVVGVAMQPRDGSDGWQLPQGAEMETNPVPITQELLARGQSLYKAKCQRCHGANGAGHGPEADPDHPAGDLTDAHRASRNPDGVMFYKIWHGRAKPKMPAMKGDMSPADIWTLINYVKTLRRG